MNNAYLLLYIITWIVTIIAYQIHKKHFDSGSVLLLSYLIYSVISLILYNSHYYKFNRIDLFPFIYLYLMLMLAISPILRYNAYTITEIQKPNTILLNTISIIFIVASLAHLPATISDFAQSIVKLLTSSSGGQELYNIAMSRSYLYGRGNISNLAAIFFGAFLNIGILMFFYHLTLNKPNKLILIGLVLSFLAVLMTYVSLGQRGCIAEILFSMIITYFALRKFFNAKVKRLIKIFAITFIIAVSIPLIYITKSRFENTTVGSEQSLYFYMGQENLYFNNYGLNDGGIRYGDRTFPLFKQILGFDSVPHNFWERRKKYQKLTINDEVFVTFVGDFTLDFGPFIASIIFLLFTLFVLNMTKIHKSRILFHQLILIHFIMCVCMIGGMKLYSFSDVGGNLSLIVYFIAYISFRLDYDLNIQRKKDIALSLVEFKQKE